MNAGAMKICKTIASVYEQLKLAKIFLQFCFLSFIYCMNLTYCQFVYNTHGISLKQKHNLIFMNIQILFPMGCSQIFIFQITINLWHVEDKLFASVLFWWPAFGCYVWCVFCYHDSKTVSMTDHDNNRLMIQPHCTTGSLVVMLLSLEMVTILDAKTCP